MDAERCKLILGVASEGFWDWDLRSDRAYLSPRYCELIAYPCDTFFDRSSFLLIVHPDDREAVRVDMEECLRGERELSVTEFRLLTDDGTTRWIEGRAKPVEYDVKGRPTRVVGTIVDITARKLAELENRARQEEFRTAFEEASDAILWADAETGIITNCNRAAEAMLEATRGEIIGQHQTFLHPPELAGHFSRMFQNDVTQGDTAHQSEAVICSRRGRRVPVLIRNTFTTSGGRRIVQGVFRDITRQKEAEESLRYSQRLLTSILDNAPFAFFVKDVNDAFRVILWNRAAEKVFGIPAAIMLGKNAHDLWPREQADAYLCADRAVVASRAPVDIPVEVSNHPERGHIHLHTYKIPLLSEVGEVGHIAVFSQDITTRVQVDAEILALNSELERRVAERTRELEQVVQEQQSFCHTVSHDLRAPLRHINCFSAILLEEHRTGLAPEARYYLERIGDTTRKMGDLIDHLLGLSRVSRTELHVMSVDLSQLARAITDMLRETDPGRAVRITIDEGLVAQGDPALLHQLLENLLVNAWKYSVDRSPAQIEFGRQVEGGSERFFVRDNGVGFDMAYQDKLFEVFQRLHGAEFEGTGIGLAIAQRIVKRHGGTIWASASVNGGATFYFTLGEP